ncbi:hypothetical protein [Mammaliicoccus fleurettii]|uniref:hypothetical protein n=1 Tax=Mammaliicoccus fleurettii TaxID=150056 RepID=UPI002DBCEAD1|nr:hypothetical protein [Mammaliicoccus fleurettii]MEB8068151.1 hypothetical protein [Mammaliicoccus fleurettii]
MVQTINQISLYKKLNEKLAESVNIDISYPNINYIDKNEKKDVIVNEGFNDVLTINSFDSMWSPNENNLNISQLFVFSHPNLLYGTDGITMNGNEIGIGAHIHSRNSSFQKTLHVISIPEQEEEFEAKFTHNFNVGYLRGSIIIDFFLYLKKITNYDNKQANKVGMVLSEGNIHSLEIVVDGDGSAFPMTEFKDKNGPLWKLEKNWIEPNLDMFDVDNVSLSLNTAHPLFEQVKSSKTRASKAMMDDIMINAMSLIIQQVLLVEKYSIDTEEELVQGSILQAVKYWVSTFEVDTTTIFTISNSLRTYWSKQMLEGEKSYD